MKQVNKLLFMSCCLFSASFIMIQSGCSQKEETPALSKEQMIERGRYLTTIASCQDCHSPKIMTPNGPVVDETRAFSGAPADSKLPPIDTSEITPGKWYLGSSDLTTWVGPWGVSFAANLTPDKTTGSGAWTEEIFIKMLRTGKFMAADAGRPIMPPMPWEFINKMTDEDLKCVFTYLQSLPPVVNSVPAYIPPNEIAAMK